MVREWVFQLDEPLLRKARNELDNYQVLDNPMGDQDKCTVYFSSNFLYSPNVASAVQRSIFDMDYYEWKYYAIKDSGRHIYVRDVYKQWYLEGINDRVDSIEKLGELLGELTRSFRTIICIGASAGGYAATLYGGLLKAQHVFCFNGQFDLRSIASRADAYAKNPFVLAASTDVKKQRYLNLKPFCASSRTQVFYFQSANCPSDVAQFAAIQDCERVRRIIFKTSNHGVPFLKPALKRILVESPAQLELLVSRTHSPLLFSFRYGGVVSCVKLLTAKLSHMSDIKDIFKQWSQRVK
jgi:hypothetical protein